jgi:hypothetical protein
MSNRDVIWQRIRQMGKFTIHDIPAAIRTKTVQSYVEGLLKAGYIAQLTNGKVAGRWQLAQYQLVRDVGIEAPKVTRYGKPTTHGLGQEQMWRTMPILGEFTARELALAASTEQAPVSVWAARGYIRLLGKAGYLFVVTPGYGDRPALYRMPQFRHTGPRPPQNQQNGTVYDLNPGRLNPSIRKGGGNTPWISTGT